MLFTDSDVVTVDDLEQIDSLVSATAKSTKPHIRLAGPRSICEQAWRECGQQITAAMQMYTSYLTQPGMTGGHIAAVLNTGVPARTQPRIRLNQIVAHESQYGNAKSSLQTWMAYVALHLFYREAALRTEKDIYEERAARYETAAKRWWGTLRTNGLPFTWTELERPGAKHSVNPGVWTDSPASASNVTAAAVAGTTGGNFRVAVTYVDQSRYQSQPLNGNAESAPSDALPILTAAGQAISISIASLNPPNGQPDNVGLSQGAYTPLNATGWNVWVGAQVEDSPLYLQNSSPIPIATKSYTLASDPTLTGFTAGQGQWQDLNQVFASIISRG